MLNFVTPESWNIVVIINYIVAVSAVITILLKNLNPTKTLSYIIVLIFFPFLGILIYYLFGQEYRKNKIFNRKNVLNQTLIKKIHKDLELNNSEIKKVDDFLDEKIKLVKLLYSSKYSPLTLRNKTTIIKNGENKLKHLKKDIAAAKNHIHFEYYILKDDSIGAEILNMLAEKAAQGVEVRIAYDDVGSSISRAMKLRLKASGVQMFPFMPVLFSSFAGKMNYRNHRKIVVIDGCVGYVGGINLSDEYCNVEHCKIYWRDTHLRIEGEAVKSLQTHFLTTWDFVSNRELKITKDYFPEYTTEKGVPIQIAASGPDTDWANIMEVMFTAMVCAEDYIYITTPYFVPNDQIIASMQVAARSGVDVRLIIPYESDSWVVKHATNSYLERILEAGVRVFLYKKGFIHAKTIAIDDVFSTIGTSNMDYRSFNINFEINAFMYDEKQAIIVKKHFMEDLEDSEEVDFKAYLNRSKFNKLKESYARLWSPLI